MRLYQHANQGLDQPTLLYERDAPNGCCFVICGYCHAHFNTTDAWGWEQEECPMCGNDLVYPKADW